MNRYPLWKYIVIAAALLFSVIYALPNFYGESPAVQIAAVKGAEKPNPALLQRVETLLAQKHLAYQGTLLDADGVKVRFANTDTQLKAKDWLQSQLGGAYSVALNLLPRSPNWLSDIGALPMYLGLDLRGGVHFLLQVDMKAAVDKSLGRMVGEIRTALREKDIRYSGAHRQGNVIEVRFRTAAARAQAEARLATDTPDLQFKERDEGGAFLLAGTLKSTALKRMQDYAVQQNITTLRNRVNELGVAEPVIQQQGGDRVVVELPGVQDTAKAKEILGRTATLEIRMVDEAHSDPASLKAAAKGQVPYGDDFYVDREGSPLLVKKAVVLTGESINNARPGFDSQSGEPAVDITLDGGGARIFQRVTRENVGKRMAILLVEQGKAEVVTAPVIRSEIAGGRVQISGRMTTREASDVALLLRAGALAAPMNIVEERTVGPSLGAANIKQGFDSTLIGFAAIALFMMFYYRLFGALSTVALAVNLLLLVGVLSVLQATLTLPGIAGIALTVGMAIDANVLINERIREELRNGSTPQASIHAGYDRAFDTILDSNITTLIAGIALFWLGSGPVRGFAVTLCIGIVTSMFSAVMVSRGFANLIYGRRRRLSTLSI
ncbi:MAG TPA: protein translocase subunit SecD [Betaproteobacteria bacterium]|nr:protein translocase subunit SecD [Betaproteobacteria bacterium]